MSNDAPKSSAMTGITKIALFVTVLAVISAVVYTQFKTADQSPVTTSGPGLPTVQIGGPFTLVDHSGKTVTEKSFPGKYLLVFFGYTFCPDVCPTDLAVISDALDRLPEADRDQIQPLFISVDPARDTAEVLKDFVTHFHPKMIGLTGTPENIAQTARLYRAYYAKAGDPNAKEDYLMDHSATTYMMGPDGSFLTTFSHAMEPEAMATGIQKFIK